MVKDKWFVAISHEQQWQSGVSSELKMDTLLMADDERASR
jgi:hypothetical protein